MLSSGQQRSAAITLDSLACIRGGRLLFEGLNLSLRAGDAALIQGANGAGKSSLLRMIAGLLRPAAGRIERQGRLALADDNLALDRAQSLTHALKFWARIDGCHDAVHAAQTALNLDNLGHVPVRMLSTGQRKRAALARIVASGAELWLLDEPANGLDLDGLGALSRIIADHRARGGIVMIASHQAVDLTGCQAIQL